MATGNDLQPGTAKNHCDQNVTDICSLLVIIKFFEIRKSHDDTCNLHFEL